MKRSVVVGALGTAQTLAWGSSYYLPAILADPIADGLGLSASSRARCCCRPCWVLPSAAERSPGGACTHWKSAALSRRTWRADLPDLPGLSCP